jgi:polyhydroxyalkanoate synthesis regulator phasin
MSVIIKKSMQTGLSAYAKRRKEIESAVSKLMRKNQINAKEGKKMITQILARSVKIEKKVEAQVRKSLLAAVKTLKIVTKKDLYLLEKKLKRGKRK